MYTRHDLYKLSDYYFVILSPNLKRSTTWICICIYKICNPFSSSNCQSIYCCCFSASNTQQYLCQMRFDFSLVLLTHTHTHALFHLFSVRSSMGVCCLLLVRSITCFFWPFNRQLKRLSLDLCLQKSIFCTKISVTNTVNSFIWSISFIFSFNTNQVWLGFDRRFKTLLILFHSHRFRYWNFV